ncbi:sigma 54 modulation/S30EA ribosomal C-terminal domain-containing protein [Catenulispora subtropica]|uniref:HPF/RaiA family ribosome-associated protein n=1 Tax=Catenulispora subtropica TaxID=450798 RepID=A0ABN2RLN9_9ACTN
MTVGITVRGALSDDEAAWAHDRIAETVARAHGRVSAVSVRLTGGTEAGAAAPGRPAVVQVNLTVDDCPLRVQAAAVTIREAVDLAVARLRELTEAVAHRDRHFGHTSRPFRADRRGPGAHPARRTIVRRKVFALEAQTPDEAADTLESRDYDFHLFVDAESGVDSVIYRGAPEEYILAQVEPGPAIRGATRVPVTVNAVPAPRMPVSHAKKELATLESPFLFFADEDTGRGNVLYRRYDGGYGLIVPA